MPTFVMAHISHRNTSFHATYPHDLWSDDHTHFDHAIYAFTWHHLVCVLHELRLHPHSAFSRMPSIHQHMIMLHRLHYWLCWDKLAGWVCCPLRTMWPQEAIGSVGHAFISALLRLVIIVLWPPLSPFATTTLNDIAVVLVRRTMQSLEDRFSTHLHSPPCPQSRPSSPHIMHLSCSHTLSNVWLYVERFAKLIAFNVCRKITKHATILTFSWDYHHSGLCFPSNPLNNNVRIAPRRCTSWYVSMVLVLLRLLTFTLPSHSLSTRFVSLCVLQ